MAFTASTPRELRRSKALVRLVRRQVAALQKDGKKVHFIWDVDHVLVSGRSDDAFALLGFDVVKYFEYEERLVTQRLEDGPWAGLARECGQLHQSQDIVTARSSFLALRAIYFLLSGFIPSRWQLFVGHQPKDESYRIILKSFAKESGTHVFCVDDSAKHVEAFNKMALELGMSERCHGILSPQVRSYEQDALQHEVDSVMAKSGPNPGWVRVFDPQTGQMTRMIQVLPDPREALRRIFDGGVIDAHKKATVEEVRPSILEHAERHGLYQPKNDDEVYAIFELIREPH